VIERLRALRRPPQTAGEWFAARQRRPDDAELQRRFEAWLAERPERRREYALREVAWELAAPAAESYRAITAERRHASVQMRRRFVVGAGLAAGLAAASVTWWTVAPVQAAQYTTAAGEQRSIVLADGSTVTLNTRTELQVRVYRNRRDVQLSSGEAHFDVARDESRPFRVRTSLGEARVLGTRFTVYHRPDSLEVTTEEGLVQVTRAGTTATDAGATVLVRPGERAVVAEGEDTVRLGAGDLQRIANWRSQRVEFDGVPLTEALTEFSRYSGRTIRPANAEVGAIRISGVFRTGDLAALQTGLSESFGLKISSAPGGAWVVDRADASH
jgi:transmembrane sensor